MQYRAVKAEELSRAKAAWRTGLQREGVQRWLEVGLARRQLRLRDLAEQKVRGVTWHAALGLGSRLPHAVEALVGSCLGHQIKVTNPAVSRDPGFLVAKPRPGIGPEV